MMARGFGLAVLVAVALAGAAPAQACETKDHQCAAPQPKADEPGWQYGTFNPPAFGSNHDGHDDWLGGPWFGDFG